MAELNAGLNTMSLSSSTGTTRPQRIIAIIQKSLFNRAILIIMTIVILTMILFSIGFHLGHSTHVSGDLRGNADFQHEGAESDGVSMRTFQILADKMAQMEQRQLNNELEMKENIAKIKTEMKNNFMSINTAIESLNTGREGDDDSTATDVSNGLLKTMRDLNSSVFTKEEEIAKINDKLEPLLKIGTELKAEVGALQSQMERLAMTQMVPNTTQFSRKFAINGEVGTLMPYEPRHTCLDHFNNGQTADGLYLIDPDGINFGEPPITVICTQGITLALHDSMEVTVVDHCTNPGCFIKNISYKDVDMNQLITLISISETCQQSIQFGCMLAPLHDDGIDQGWWLDRNGQKQTYFTGRIYGSHGCACASNQSCIQNKKCNCDAHVPGWSQDVGYITNQTALPITGFAYGGLQYDMEKANFSIGGLQCKGARQPVGKVKSCRDLFLLRSGFTGYQWVWDEHLDSPKIVFCNFHVNIDDPNFETPVKLKAQVLAFEMKRSSNVSHMITYDTIAFASGLDGDSLNKDKGIFKVPQTGFYEFKFQAQSYVSSQRKVTIWASYDGVMKEQIYRFTYSAGSYYFSGRGYQSGYTEIASAFIEQKISVYWTQMLTADVKVGVYCQEGTLKADSTNPIRFSGRLMEIN